MNILDSSKEYLINHYEKVLNPVTPTRNDINTPIQCVKEMLNVIPETFYDTSNENLKILDPCCGNGNFFLILYHILLYKGYSSENILQDVLHFNDINTDRLKNVKEIFCSSHYDLNVSSLNFLEFSTNTKYDLIIANPPYAKIMKNGERASKNHNMIQVFIEKAIECLKPNGYLLFITPDNWMSLADRNKISKILTTFMNILHLNIHGAKKYFKKVGSSFVWFLAQSRNVQEKQQSTIEGIYKKYSYTSQIIIEPRDYIPLIFDDLTYSILSKTLDKKEASLFNVKTSSYLHFTNKRSHLTNVETSDYKYSIIHTPKQMYFSDIPHIHQFEPKVFISLTDNYQIIVDEQSNIGMTQSVAYIITDKLSTSKKYEKILKHPLYIFLNNICRWGNFNNVRILQRFPIPEKVTTHKGIYKYFDITLEEQKHIETFV